MRRRDLLSLAAAAPAVAESRGLAGRICLFTDHLAGFTWQDAARMLKDLGVTGPDLTVRKGGLVDPARAAADLPKAARTFAEAGLTIPMITTAITSVDDPDTRPLLEAASKLQIRHYKLGYYKYGDPARFRETLAAAHKSLIPLAALNRKLNLQAGLHNHAGDAVGCCFWDSFEALEGIDVRDIGFYFDPAQATIEGGKLGWNFAFRRMMPRIVMIAIKDFVWQKAGKNWRTRWVPLGEGMVDWDTVIPLIKSAAFNGPISLHIEYDPGGETQTGRYDRALEAAAKDLRFLRQRLEA